MGAFVTIHDENEIEFREVLSRSSKKKEKKSAWSKTTPCHDPIPPSQNLGIHFKISPDTPFEINKIA